MVATFAFDEGSRLSCSEEASSGLGQRHGHGKTKETLKSEASKTHSDEALKQNQNADRKLTKFVEKLGPKQPSTVRKVFSTRRYQVRKCKARIRRNISALSRGVGD